MHAKVIRYFVEVVRAGSIRKAAEQLHVVPTAVNRQILNLEEELGAQLLHISVWGALLLGVGSVFSGVMRAAGTVRTPMLISLACLAFLQFPVGWAINRAVGLPWLWFTYLVTYGCGA
eukprot:gene38508-50569_t